MPGWVKYFIIQGLFFFTSATLANDIITATSEDILEFDKILAEQPLPDDLKKQQEREEKQAAQKKMPKPQARDNSLRGQFEPDVKKHVGAPPVDKQGPPVREPLGPRREQGRRKFLMGPPPPPPMSP